MFNLIVAVFIILLLLIFVYRRQWQNALRPKQKYFEASGSPSYIAGSTSGSPLSEMGSHFGFKAVPERKSALSTALFATIASFGAGRLCDFAVCLQLQNKDILFNKPVSRKVIFEPFSIEEKTFDRGIELKSKLFFLQNNVAVIETCWKSSIEILAKPVFYLLPTSGRDLENPYPHFNGFSFFKNTVHGLMLKNYQRMPGLKLFTYFLSYGKSSKKRKEIAGNWVKLKPGEEVIWPVIISFSPGEIGDIENRAEHALANYDSLKKSAHKRWSRFKSSLPSPYREDDPAAKQLMILAASALWNNLYYPRLNMKKWGSVPSKVYFPFIWGWDTPQHVIGLSEYNLNKAKAVLLTQLRGNYFAPEKARFKIKLKGISIISSQQRSQIPSKLNDSLKGVLSFYSQPPLQSWAAVGIHEYLQCSIEKEKYLREALPLLENNIRWWEENRRLKSGLFSYLNGLESGLDDSPRFYPPSFLPSFIIGIVPRFFAAVDLNCWLYQSYLNIAYLSERFGGGNFASLRKKADELKALINTELFSDEHGCWLDKRNGKFIEVFTPSVWWPLLTGAAEDTGKAKMVISNYLLDQDRFWGEYGIPSVAFNDPLYNHRKDGYYWRGQIWMINNYVALELLYRYGYYEKAEELHKKIIRTLVNSKGLFETYNAKTGAIGWSSRGPGDPAVMQFGMSSAWAIQILLRRYQRFSYILPDTRELYGHIKWAATPECFSPVSPPGLLAAPVQYKMKVKIEGVDSHKNVPYIYLKSTDGLPLVKTKCMQLYIDSSSMPILQERKVEFSWLDQTFMIHPGVTYQLRKVIGEKWELSCK